MIMTEEEKTKSNSAKWDERKRLQLKSA